MEGEVTGGRPVESSALTRAGERDDRLRSETEHLIESQRLLEESRNRFAELYNLAPLPCVTLDRLGVIRSVNLMAAALLRAEARHLIGIPMRILITADDRRSFLGHLSRCQREEKVVSCDVRIVCRSGLVIPVRLSSRRVSTPDELCATSLIDLTEQEHAAEERRRLTENEREARAASEAKDQFIAMLSHELRTPLTPVLAAVSAAARRKDLPDSVKPLFAMIERNIEAETRLIDDLLDVTRISRGKMNIERKPVEVHRTVMDALDLLGPEIQRKGLRVGTGLQAEHYWICGDPLRLRQVFSNIIQNAVKFTPPGGRIDIRSWDRGSFAVIEVSDSGVGIGSDILPRLFVPFEQAPDESAPSRAGLGLGLAISRGIIELHGGRINATSQGVGKGARFVIDVPIIPPPKDAEIRERAPGTVLSLVPLVPTPPPAGLTPIEAKPRILLVEDDAETADTLAELLRDEGYDIRVANSLHTALETDMAAVDLIVSDIGLGDGSGLELMRQVRTRKDVKGIVLSGFGTESDIRASQDAGFSMHLVKPVSFDGLIQAIAATARGPSEHRL